MSATYAAILAALAADTPLTYGGLTRSERMHVQSMRRDDLAVVTDARGAVLESLDATDPSVKASWRIGLTVRGREVARALSPFATGAPVIGKPESSKPEGKPAAKRAKHAAPSKGETCGAITRKGTPCGARISSSTGACSLVPAHGGPVTVTRVESAPAPVVESAPALDVDAIARALAGILAGAR